MTEIAHVIGYAMLWGLGLFGIPLFLTFATALFFKVKDINDRRMLFLLFIFFYILLTAIVLVNI